MNPLDFQARKQMVLEGYPEATVLYIKNVEDDKVWSRNLDTQIADVIGPRSTVMLYGGRASFIDSYHGKWPTTELKQEGFLSATVIRKEIAKTTQPDKKFRAGAIWQAYNRYPMLIPKVGVAIWSEDGTELLLGKKPNEKGWRFIGGVAQPEAGIGLSGCYETSARREVHDAAGVEVTDPQYVGSTIIDDWQLRGEVDDIGAMLFECKYMYGNPKLGDDIEELQWTGISKLERCIIDAHKHLLDLLKLNTKLGNFDVEDPVN